MGRTVDAPVAGSARLANSKQSIDCLLDTLQAAYEPAELSLYEGVPLTNGMPQFLETEASTVSCPSHRTPLQVTFGQPQEPLRVDSCRAAKRDGNEEESSF